MIHTVEAVIAGFNPLIEVAQVFPVFEGDTRDHTITLDETGELAIDNDKYTIDSEGRIFAIAAPALPVNHFVRYRIQTDHDSCQFIEDVLQVRWSASDLTPNVVNVIGEIHSLGQVVAFISNAGGFPASVVYNLIATADNTEGAFNAASVFTINEQGQIVVEDYYLLQEEVHYNFRVQVIDESNQAVFESRICLGPFTKGGNIATSTIPASETCVPFSTTTALPLDCAVLAPFYPAFLNAEELAFYTANCLSPEPPVPIFAIMYEPCLTDALEARSYTVRMNMLGLDSQINSPQLLEFEEGETTKVINLVGAVSQISATRSKTSLVLEFTIGTETVTSVNIQDRDLDPDPLVTTYSESVAGYGNDFTYSVESLQLYGKADDHGDYMREGGICYGRVTTVLGANPDSFTEPDGGEFLTKSECEV